MAKPSHPSNLELQALSVLWHEGPSTVGVIKELMADGRERAYTTVLSVMQSLERKKLVKRTREGRAHTYHPRYSQEVIVRRATESFITSTFGGRLGEAVLATLSAGNLTPDEKTEIERELQQHRTMAAKKTAKKTATKAAKSPATKTAKKATVKKAAAEKVVKKAAKTVASSTKAPAAKKVVVKKVAKSAKTVAKKATKQTVAKKAAKKAPAKSAPAKKAAKPTVKAAPAKKTAKKSAAKTVAKKTAKKAAKKS